MINLIKPTIQSIKKVAASRLFHVEQVELTFSNGQKRIYERLSQSSHRAVMVIPMVDHETFLLVKEYSVGIDSYTLSFPKGQVESQEELFVGANRELMEEVGKGAHSYEYLKDLMLSPNYMTNSISVVIASDLYDKKLEGDEPEPLEVVPWRLSNIDELLEREDFLESRSITALLLLWKKWKSNN